MAEETTTEETTTETEAPRAGGFLGWAQKIRDNDPRMQQFQGLPEPTEIQQMDMRVTAQEIQQDIQHAQNDFQRLNPDATETEVEEYITAVYERDVVTLDRIQKEVARKKQEKEKAEENDKKEKVSLNTSDTSKEGGGEENRFTGQNTRTGIRRILFGNQ